MIKPETVRVGMVFRDPEFPRCHMRFTRYVPATTATDDAVWYAEPISTSRAGGRRRYRPADFKRLEPASDEVFIETDLSALVGLEVVVETDYGSGFAGTLTHVITHEVTILDKKYDVLSGVVVGGENIPTEKIVQIRLARKRF